MRQAVENEQTRHIFTYIEIHRTVWRSTGTKHSYKYNKKQTGGNDSRT